ncbi:MAG: hypothetical protein J6T94_03440 [Bacteroidaceae bacterium]|nr:hypothetical protein [Bacteroidaceae bacterium]
MKKLSVLFALLAVAMMAKADFVVTASDTPFVPGSEENELVLTASESMQTFTAFQFDMVLPEGLTFDYAYSSAFREEKEKGKWIAMHNWQEGVPEDGEGIRIFVMDGSNNNASFADVTEIITLGFIADATFKGGTITFKKAVFSSTDSSKDVKLDDFDVTVTVAGASQTDVAFTMTAAHAGTLILPFAAEIPADYDWVAYTDITLNGKTLVLGESTTTLLANTPYYIEGEKEGTYTFSGTPTNEAASVKNGILTGVFVDTEIEAGVGNYVLQNQEVNGVGFYNVKTKAKTIPAYRCYITVPSDTESNMYRIGGTTGIEEVTVEEAGDVYDMLGRKVLGPLEKGVYIKNNRKIFVK